MRSDSAMRATAGRALWLGAMLLTLAGLFGMHGLGDHGIDGAEGHDGGNAHAAMTAMPSTTSMPSTSSPTLTLAAGSSSVAHSGAGLASSGLLALHGPGGMGMSMGAGGMCLAVLLLTLIAALVLGQARRLQPIAVLSPRLARAPSAPGRTPDPPNLFGLSIQRC